MWAKRLGGKGKVSETTKGRTRKWAKRPGFFLRFRRLSETSSSPSIRRISGDNEFYSIYPNGKVFIFGFRATLYARVLCKVRFTQKAGVEDRAGV